MSQSSSIANPDAQKTILFAGVTAGTLDILTAFVHYYLKTGKNPVGILKYVASGAFGSTALSGGTAVAVWGLVFHYMIAFSFTLFFFLLYPRLKFLSVNKWLTAVGYGLFVWAVMNLAIVPMSQVPKSAFHLSNALIAATILVFMIGLPLTLIIGNYYSKQPDRS
jgi:hypothetical protein